ncbi:PAS domain-containing protein [Steroidobacter sp.]|uniref:PAS domain-containing protein n=1 Tax=Steroidobacter sp. TaxID=1978227 RepID=UPI001A610811|nr:PAS domain-containing protein [Steroidobacter sp.]MBL8270398.1 PAS domain-containing protein [Steroidobacter sp.]
MVQFDVTHLASIALGALLGAGALWALHRLRGRQPDSKGQEDALRAELKLATEIAGIGVWRLDVATRRVTCDATLQRLLGSEAVIPDGLMPVLPEDRERTRKGIDDAVHSPERGGSLRTRIVRPDGQVRHIQTHFRRVFEATREHPAGELIGVSRDITEEVEQANRQRVLADRLNIATEAARISCWEVNTKERRFAWIENPLSEIYGEPPELSLDAHIQRMHPEDRIATEARLIQARDSGEERLSYRYRIYGHNGRLLHIQTHARLFRCQSGYLQLLGVSWEVTKEIEAADRLQQQAQQLRDVERRLERASLSSSEGHWEKDLLQTRMWFSSSYHALLGFEDGELSSDPAEAAERVHPDDLAAGRAELQRHVEEGRPFDTFLRLRMKSGEYRWFRHRGMAERDEHGLARLIAGSIQDAHEQKLAEDALRHTQQRLERAIQGTQDGLWEMDGDGSSWHSPRVAELLGYESEQLPTGTNFLKEFLHPEDAAAVAHATRVHFQDRLPYDVEIRLRTRSGDYRWYRARATAERDAQGRPLRLSGSLQDVTEARAAREALLSATEAAESANQAKSEFLANVSHEIRTPMNGIIGMTGLLMESALNRTQRDYAETIRSSADSLLIVINDILDFSKIEAGKLDIEALELDLRNTVEEVAVMLAFQAAAKNLELVVHIHPDVPDRVVGDPQRIRQCLINLVSNAIKFTREGEIVIEVSSYDVGDGRRRCRFEVRDTGIGIAPGTLQNLFQPFVQADSSTTRHFGGTGLGLSIVRRLVQMMGGEVGALSELNKGSRFWFNLPLPSAPQAIPTPVASTDHSRQGRRVLVVDDNETNRRVLAGQLMHAGFEVSLAGGGIEAMSLLHTAAVDGQPFDVVLADHRMHDMDGATLGERVNADARLSHARLVMLTSVDGHGDIQLFASLGFAAYLTKPVRTRELLECLDRVLAHDSKTWHMKSQPIVTRNTLGTQVADTYRGTVLLVEDNAVNQKVAVRFLERMGCTVRVADNGVEAVRACEETTFDLILMDLQMPVMDGLTATMRIRERETGDGRANAPIVALTANAMTSQLERCMEAGMNAFLTKPLEIPRLHEVLTRFGLRVTLEDTVMTQATADHNVPVNLSRLNELTDGDPEFTRELVATFIASGEQAMDEARASLAALDRHNLSRIAHKLKGASANIHAEPLRNLSHTLEAQASSLDQQRLAELVSQLAVELERAKDFLNQYAPPLTAKAG